MHKTLAGAALVSLVAVCPARAENIWDINGKFVGTVVGKAPDGATLALITYNGVKFFVEIGTQGFVQENVTIYYSQANCQGQAEIAIDVFKELVGTGMFDGQTLWGVDARRSGYYVMNSRLDQTGCLNFTSETVVSAAPAFQVPGFSGPFLAK